MAPGPPLPAEAYEIRLTFAPSRDRLLTCLICGRENVELECTVRDGRGQRITMGKHVRCMWKVVVP
jgi:hypothetical protein